jgi:4-hydroxy-tetrahydrodipicolinate synthase
VIFMEFKGVYTALITPFRNGAVDYDALTALVEKQIAGKVAGIVPVGTTGESPTVSPEEHLKIIEAVVKCAAGRCQVIAGTGANSTEEAVYLTNEAKAIGADATLQVTPYYNKPTQEGLYRHFSTIADKCELPVVLYNVPGRTGTMIAAETIAKLSRNANVLGVKEAAGSVERVSEIASLCDIAIMCGDDSLTVPMMSVGAKGVISVASNIIPAELKAMVDACENGDYAKALILHKKYFRLFKDLFLESNPIPVKAAMAMLGMVREEYRLPLCEMQSTNRDKLKATLSNALGKEL